MTHSRRPRALAVPRPRRRPRAGLARPALLLLAALALRRSRAEAADQVTNPDGTITSHGLSIFGDLKYPADFKHFDYVNPDAPKGGIHRTWDLGSYDSLTPFTEKGDAADERLDRLRQPDGQSSLDSLDQMYGLIAESVTYPPDKQLGQLQDAPRGPLLRRQPAHRRGRASSPST